MNDAVTMRFPNPRIPERNKQWFAQSVNPQQETGRNYALEGFGCACGSSLPKVLPRTSPWTRNGMGATSFLSVASPVGAGMMVAQGALGLTSMIENMITTWGHNAYNVKATVIVNDAERILQQNVANWQSSPKCAADQAAAVSIFQQVWNAVVSQCGQIAGGNSSDAAAAGTRCVNDRVRGGKFDWFAAYLDPIQKDPQAQQTYDPFTGQILGTVAGSHCNSSGNYGGQSATSTPTSGDTPSGGATAPGTGAGTSAPPATSAVEQLSTPVLGVPLWVWLAGGVAAFFAMREFS